MKSRKYKKFDKNDISEIRQIVESAFYRSILPTYITRHLSLGKLTSNIVTSTLWQVEINNLAILIPKNTVTYKR
jgi:hypothetical protein